MTFISRLGELKNQISGRRVPPRLTTFRVEPGAAGEGEGLAFRSANLTPDSSGVLVKIGSRDAWIKRFRAGRVYKGSPMPWGSFALMTDADLEALWVYFNALQPVTNQVQTVFRDTTRAQ